MHTIEATIIMAVFLFILGNVMTFSLELYEDVVDSSAIFGSFGEIEPGELLMCKHIGGEIYSEAKNHIGL